MESMVEAELAARQKRPDELSGGCGGAVFAVLEERLQDGEFLLVGRAGEDVADGEVDPLATVGDLDQSATKRSPPSASSSLSLLLLLMKRASAAPI